MTLSFFLWPFSSAVAVWLHFQFNSRRWGWLDLLCLLRIWHFKELRQQRQPLFSIVTNLLRNMACLLSRRFLFDSVHICGTRSRLFMDVWHSRTLWRRHPNWRQENTFGSMSPNATWLDPKDREIGASSKQFSAVTYNSLLHNDARPPSGRSKSIHERFSLYSSKGASRTRFLSKSIMMDSCRLVLAPT